jgi:hypothetical protein
MRGPQSIGFSERQRRAILTLLTAHSTPAAAKEAGVHSRTLQEWLKKPEFRAAYEQAARERFEDGVHQLRAATSEAVETLRTALHDEHPAIRVRAASILLEVVVKVNVDELTRRVEALEAAQQSASGADMLGMNPPRIPREPDGADSVDDDAR